MLPLEDDTDYSDELEEAWEIFAEDGKEALDLVEEALLALEANASQADQIARLFRGLHKFKGNARMMGLSALESLFHHAEDMAALVRDEGVPLTSEMIELLLGVLDRSRAILEHTVAHRCEVECTQVEDLIQRLSEVLDRYTRPPSEPAATAPISDPGHDPLYVRIFLEMVRDELECLPRLLAAVTSNHSTQEAAECIQKIRAIADALSHAAGRLGYTHLITVLHKLGEVVEGPPGEERNGRLKEAVRALSKELADLEQTSHALGVEVHVDMPLFEDWGCAVPRDMSSEEHVVRAACEKMVEAVLARLSRVIELLTSESAQMSWDGPPPMTVRRAACKAANLLRSVYPMCVFHKLEQAAYLSLALVSLYTDVASGKLSVSLPLLHITRTYADALRRAFQGPGDGRAPEPSPFAGLLAQVEEMHIAHFLARLHLEPPGAPGERLNLPHPDPAPNLQS
ncbi:MAG: Hpt domain-containing protein [Anaerolineae bacterium]|nr:Hpt domain-containing protein [Anaerolineae bacterium]